MVIDANAMEPPQLSAEGFQAIAGWGSQVAQHSCVVEHVEPEETGPAPVDETETGQSNAQTAGELRRLPHRPGSADDRSSFAQNCEKKSQRVWPELGAKACPSLYSHSITG